jgi:hypothetical protein
LFSGSKSIIGRFGYGVDCNGLTGHGWKRVTEPSPFIQRCLKNDGTSQDRYSWVCLSHRIASVGYLHCAERRIAIQGEKNRRQPRCSFKPVASPLSQRTLGRGDQHRAYDKRRRKFTPQEGQDSLIEFPIGTTKFLGANFPIGGGGYFRLLSVVLTQRGIQRVNKREKQLGCFTFIPGSWTLTNHVRQCRGITAFDTT